jgi:ABC-type multidrug transport system permease subunit
MNADAPKAMSTALAPAPRWGRRRLIVIVAASITIAAVLVGSWYLMLCSNCGHSPILCTDPCTLPTFG